MRTTLGMLASMLVMATAVGSGGAAFALDDASTLRCDATLSRSASRLFSCLALCQDKVDKFGADVADSSRCTARCEARYTHALLSPRCAESFVQRMAVSELADLDATSLRCGEADSKLDAGLFSCLASCAEQVEFAARRGAEIDPGPCVDACADDDAAATARAEARTGCVLHEAEE